MTTNQPVGIYIDKFGAPVARIVGGGSVEIPTGTALQVITCPRRDYVNVGTSITFSQ